MSINILLDKNEIESTSTFFIIIKNKIVRNPFKNQNT